MKPFDKTRSPVHVQQEGNFSDAEIKSHSSLLTNERLAILFYTLDYTSINLNTYYDQTQLLKTKAILNQIYKNIRSIIRNSPVCRTMLNLDTNTVGVYTTDVAFDLIERMVQYCTFNGFTYRRCFIISRHLNEIEIILRDILQFFMYFYRTQGKSKPDIFTASEGYKDMADKLTIDELKSIVGKNHKIDFEKLENNMTETKEDLFEEDESRFNRPGNVQNIFGK